jgi:ribosomal protein S18 acetylase RimI-like enzyme
MGGRCRDLRVAGRTVGRIVNTAPPVESHPLDNPVWSSLSAAHADLADLAEVDGGRAGRYQRGVSPFGAVADPRSPSSWTALAYLLEGRGVVLIIDPDELPGGWEVISTIPGVQMDGTLLEPVADRELRMLHPADVPEMLALVERTRPGPFLSRTIEMGSYVGLHRRDSLIAMAGERFRPAGWTEVSAVCTQAAFRGQGIGARLVRAVAALIRDRDERPFLHAAATNDSAIRLYRSLGFELRRTVSFTSVREQLH